MRQIIQTLSFMMIVLSSGAFIQQIKDGGARAQGLENIARYDGFLNIIPVIWVVAVLFITLILMLTNNIRSIKFSKPMLALVMYCFLSTVWAVIPRVTFQASLLIAVAYILICVQTALYGVHSTIRFFSLTLFLILTCSLIAVIFVPSYGIGIDFEGQIRWQGVFDHKNGLGNFAAISFLVFIWQYMQKKSKLLLMAALLAIVLAVGSQSGTALANIVLIFFIFTLLSYKFTAAVIYRLRYIITILLISLSFFAIFVSINFNEFSIFEKDSSFSGRNTIWIYVLSKVSESPWIGYGLNQLSALISKNSAEFFTNVGFLVATAHNGFIETAFSLGFVGILLVFWLFFSQLTIKTWRGGFNLSFTYLISFILLNTFEARMIGFNFYFIGLMYVLVITDHPLPWISKNKQAVYPAHVILSQTSAVQRL